jgi:hypothetical protein
MMLKLSTKPDTELVSSLLNAFNEAIHAEKLFQDYLGIFTSLCHILQFVLDHSPSHHCFVELPTFKN